MYINHDNIHCALDVITENLKMESERPGFFLENVYPVKVFVTLTHRRLTRGAGPWSLPGAACVARVTRVTPLRSNQLTTAFVAQLRSLCPVISPVAASVASFLTAHYNIYNSQMKEEQL